MGGDRALTGREGAQAPGPWLEQSLERHLEDTRAELSRRLEAMATVLQDTERRDP